MRDWPTSGSVAEAVNERSDSSLTDLSVISVTVGGWFVMCGGTVSRETKASVLPALVRLNCPAPGSKSAVASKLPVT